MTGDEAGCGVEVVRVTEIAHRESSGRPTCNCRLQLSETHGELAAVYFRHRYEVDQEEYLVEVELDDS